MRCQMQPVNSWFSRSLTYWSLCRRLLTCISGGQCIHDTGMKKTSGSGRVLVVRLLQMGLLFEDDSYTVLQTKNEIIPCPDNAL